MFLNAGKTMACFAIFLLCHFANARVFKGTMETSDSFALIGRYSFFRTVPGTELFHNVSWTMKSPKGFNNLVVGAFYSDTDTWRRVFQGSTTCVEKLALASALLCVDHSNCPTKPEGLVRTGTNARTLPETSEDGITYLNTKDSYRFGSASKSRWFWFSLLNCNVRACEGESNSMRCDSPLMNITYEVTLMNLVDPRQDLKWAHLSADERGLEIILTISTAFEFILVIYSIVASIILKKRKLLHKTVIIMLVSIATMFIGSCLYLIHIGLSMLNGIGFEPLVYAAQLLYSLSTACQLLHYIFIAKGWTIVRRKISASGRVKIALYICFFFAINIACVFWDLLGLTDGVVTHFYESIPGIAVLVVRTLTVIWFIYACCTTMRRYGIKKRFYGKFLVLGIIWIAVFPGCVLLSLALNPIYRFKVILACYLTVDAGSQAVFMILYNPALSCCNKGFPFYATTPDQDDKPTNAGNFLRDEVGMKPLSNLKVLTNDLMDDLLRVRKSMLRVQEATNELQLIDEHEDVEFDEDVQEVHYGDPKDHDGDRDRDRDRGRGRDRDRDHSDDDDLKKRDGGGRRRRRKRRDEEDNRPE